MSESTPTQDFRREYLNVRNNIFHVIEERGSPQAPYIPAVGLEAQEGGRYKGCHQVNAFKIRE